MHAQLDETQEEFLELTRQIARSIGITNPSDLRDRVSLSGWPTLVSAGLVELRERSDGEPVASGVEIALLSRSLGGALVPEPYVASGALAVDLIARSGDPAGWLDGSAIHGLLLDDSLVGLADASAGSAGVVWGGGAEDSYVLATRRATEGWVLARGSIAGATALESVSPTNQLRALADIEWVEGGTLSDEDMARFEALALTALAADIEGALEAALNAVVEYSHHRVAYGVPIGSFQAVQHIAAEAFVDIAGSKAATNYAAWAIDELDADEALLAARVAKASASAIARNVAEDVMQIFGGIGQTWEHIAHFYTRRVIFDSVVFGDEEAQLLNIADARLERN